jgi:TetR/AcrR family transcriptional repressor of mexJK operon
MVLVKRKLYGTVMHDSQPPSAPRSGRDEKRTAILRIAHAAFLADGYAATSMSSIAAKVGGSKATLYNYFESKEELFGAVVRERCEDLQISVLDLRSIEGAPIRAKLEQLSRNFLLQMTSEETVATYRLVTAESARFPELGRAFYAAGPTEGRRRLGQFFEYAIANGELKPGNLLMMAEHFFDLSTSEIFRRVLWNVAPELTKEEIDAQVTSAVDVFLAAYGA